MRQLRLFPDDEQIPLPDDPDVVRMRLSSVGWTNARSSGDVWLARWLWNWLHLDEIVARHLPQGRETVAPADIVAIEVINRLCGPCSEFALAEHWYASTGLEDLLGVPDREVTKDRLYRTLDDLVEAQEPIENDLKERLGTLFRLEHDLPTPKSLSALRPVVDDSGESGQGGQLMQETIQPVFSRHANSGSDATSI